MGHSAVLWVIQVCSGSLWCLLVVAGVLWVSQVFAAPTHPSSRQHTPCKALPAFCTTRRHPCTPCPQAYEAWQGYGEWITSGGVALGPGVKERFEAAKGITPEQRAAALAARER